MTRPLPSLPEIRNLLIVKPSSLGDILHTFPLVAALSHALPDAAIDWVVNGEYASLVRRHPLIRNVIGFPRKEFGRRGFLEKFRKLRHELSRVDYDLVLDAQGLLRSALLSRLALLGQGRGTVLGFSNAREGAPFFYTRRVRVPESPQSPLHAVERNLLLLSAFGTGESGSPKSPGERGANRPSPVLRYEESDLSRVRSLLRSFNLPEEEPFLVLHPGARRESKKWPSSYFSELIRKMRGGELLRPVLLGDPAERPLLEEIAVRSCGPVPIVAGEIPLDLVPLFLSQATFFIGNDSGPLHMAAFVGIPTLSFFGSSDPGRTGPYGPPSRHHVLREPLPCSPCGDFRKSCSHMTCQVSLTPDRVLEEIRFFGALSSQGSSGPVRTTPGGRE